MEHISATDAARNFSDLLNRVRYQGSRFAITRGTEVIAQIAPAKPSRAAKLADLDARFAEMVKLDDEEVAAFERDIKAIRGEAGSPDPIWE